jgi:putative hemolysin
MDEVLSILVVLGLVGANAFLVIGEYAVVTARRGPLLARAEAGSRRAAAALQLMDDPVRVISTVQVGITAIGILVGAVGEPMVSDLFADELPRGISFLIAFSIVTYLTVVLGELVPKALTLDRSEALAMFVARPISLLATLLRPVVWFLQGSAQAVLRPFGIRHVIAGESVRTPEELRELVDQAESSGVIETAQEELLHKVLDFPRREVRDVMIPAADVAWLDAEMRAEEALERVVAEPHSRYPVGRGSLDHVAGVIHVREIVALADHASSEPIASRANVPPVVPETKDLGALLLELRQQRQQLAVVADEYGRTLGIVSLMDILEELVGEIQDEYDLPDSRIERVDPETVLVAGSMTLDDFNEELGTNLPQDGPHTVAGLLMHELGHRPEPGEEVAVAGLRLRAEVVDGARITQVRARVEPPKA